MDSSNLLPKDLPEAMDFMEGLWGLYDPNQSRKRTGENCSEDDGDEFRSIVANWGPAGISSGFVTNQSNLSAAQASQAQNIADVGVFRRSNSSLSGRGKERKRLIDQAYRLRAKKAKEDMQLSLGTLTEENESLKKENESFQKDNALMNQTLKDQAKEIQQLRSDLLHLKHEHEKQNVLVQTLSGLLAEPVRLENEKLKDENASLRKNANNVNSNFSLLAEENAKLKIENKVLKVQNDALCGKIISDSDKKREEQ